MLPEENSFITSRSFVMIISGRRKAVTMGLSEWLGGCREVYKQPGYTSCKKRYVQALFLSTGLWLIVVTKQKL
jgi:hypothetical protein